MRRVMLDPAAGWYAHGFPARVLASGEERGAAVALLDLFFAQTDKDELWETALTVEWFGDRAAVRPLAEAVYDANPDRATPRLVPWAGSLKPVARRESFD